jgi:hypothetical protein
MSARLSALVCLGIVGPCFGRPEPVPPADHPLVVYLKNEAAQSVKSMAWMKQEIGSVMRDAGFTVEFRNLQSASEFVETAHVVVVTLMGICDSAPPHLDRSVAGTKLSLASTATSDGEVLPFSELHCDAVSQVLRLHLAAQGDGERDRTYGRALGRVLAHEFYHVLAREISHVSKGVAKPCFSADDLLRAGFAFEDVAVRKMHHEHPALARVPGVTATLRRR